jgi:hypothetical protein
MGKLSEYVEEYVKDGFKRQLEQEENIVRSLPFFAAARGLLGAVAGSFGPSLGKPDPACVSSMVIWPLTAGTAILVILVIIGLVRAVWPRRYLYPTDEVVFARYARQRQDEFSRLATSSETDPVGSGLSPEQIEEAVLDDLRERVIREYSEAAAHNRTINLLRQRGRSLALTSLVLAIAMALAASSAIYMRDRMLPGIACHAVDRSPGPGFAG